MHVSDAMLHMVVAFVGHGFVLCVLMCWHHTLHTLSCRETQATYWMMGFARPTHCSKELFPCSCWFVLAAMDHNAVPASMVGADWLMAIGARCEVPQIQAGQSSFPSQAVPPGVFNTIVRMGVVSGTPLDDGEEASNAQQEIRRLKLERRMSGAFNVNRMVRYIGGRPVVAFRFYVILSIAAHIV